MKPTSAHTRSPRPHADQALIEVRRLEAISPGAGDLAQQQIGGLIAKGLSVP
jgi:hypothetical protein